MFGTISEAKRGLIKVCASGLSIQMKVTCQSLEICAQPDCEVEEYIKKHLMEGDEFSADKFYDAVDTLGDAELIGLLKYLDDVDMCLWLVYGESSRYEDVFIEDEKFYANLIENGVIRSFMDLINY